MNLLEAKMKIKIKEINVITGEEQIIERNLTQQEILERKDFETEQAIKQAEAEAKATQKAALLDRLGITEAEAKLLLG
jgi:hypothetical protein